MLQRIKVGKFTLKSWWIFFIFSQVFLISLMLVSIFVQSWVFSEAENFINLSDSSNQTTYFINLSSFKGSLSECLEGCNDIYKYSKLKSTWCFSSTQNKTSRKVCEMFENLSEAGKIFTIFEAISIVQVLIWAFTMLMFSRKVKYFGMSYCSSACGCFSHYIGFLAWLGVTGAAVQCQEMEGKVPLCFSVGPVIQIVIVFLYPLVIACYFVVSCKAYARRTDSSRVLPNSARNLGNTRLPLFAAKIVNPERDFQALEIQNDQMAIRNEDIPYAGRLRGDAGHLNDVDENTELQVDELRAASPFKKIDEKNVEHSEIILNLPPAVNISLTAKEEIIDDLEKDQEESKMIDD